MSQKTAPPDGLQTGKLKQMVKRVPVHCFALLVTACLLASPALGQAIVLEGRVTGEGGSALADATVELGGRRSTSNADGTFRLEAAGADVFTLRVAANGYYPFIHTLSRADVQPGNAGAYVLPDISLVGQVEGRRLLVFGGDAMMGRRFVTPRASEPVLVRDGQEFEDMQAVLAHVRPYLELADLASVNLETQLAEKPLPNPLDKSVTFLTHPAITPALAWAGVDYVALGNNHTYDFQEEGLAQTLALTSDAGLAYSGAGSDETSARRPAAVGLNGQPVMLYSYVGWRGRSEPSQVAEGSKGGAALGTASTIREDLDAATPEAIDVLQLHSGLEYVSEPPLNEETLLKLAIDAGADLAIGHHSHSLQGFEIYQDKLIAYSLGNFVFDQYLPSTHSSMLVYVWFDGSNLHRAEIVPLHLNGYVPTPATGRMRYDILQRLARMSQFPGTCIGESGGHLLVRPCSSMADEAPAQRLSDDGKAMLRHVDTLGARPVPPVASVDGDRGYRFGVDLLRRGDFEYMGLFDTYDRTWIDDPGVAFVKEPRRAMQITVSDETPVRTGMRVFTRVFTRSNPATLSVTLESDACANVEFKLQRRPDGVPFSEALETGPITPIGQTIVDGRAETYSFDFQLPRTFTRSIRMLVDVETCGQGPANLLLDDLALVEWRTPWLLPGQENPKAVTTETTHVQFQTP